MLHTAPATWTGDGRANLPAARPGSGAGQAVGAGPARPRSPTRPAAFAADSRRAACAGRRSQDRGHSVTPRLPRAGLHHVAGGPRPRAHRAGGLSDARPLRLGLLPAISAAHLDRRGRQRHRPRALAHRGGLASGQLYRWRSPPQYAPVVLSPLPPPPPFRPTRRTAPGGASGPRCERRARRDPDADLALTLSDGTDRGGARGHAELHATATNAGPNAAYWPRDLRSCRRS